MNFELDKLLQLDETIAKEIFDGIVYPWEVLPRIGDYILSLGKKLPRDEYDEVSKNVWVSKDATIAPTAYIAPNTIIDKGAEIRHGAYIRGNVIVGKHTVVGNSTEVKNSILFNNVQVPHYNYIGDSILGYKAHMGAASLTSNVKSDKTKVTVRIDGNIIETGLKKFGAIIGAKVEVGCSAVLNPGTDIGQNTNIYPLTSIRGYVPDNSIVKTGGVIVEKK